VLANVRLLVPVGATVLGAIVVLGVGGVPSPGGVVGVTGVILSASGGLNRPVAVVIDVSAGDWSVAGHSLGLIDTAGGAPHP